MIMPDTDATAAQIVAIEAEKHKRGWDKEPELIVLFLGPDGPDRYLFSDGGWPDGPGGEVLHDLSHYMEASLATAEGRFAVNTLRSLVPSAYAVLFMSEAWMATKDTMTSDEMKKYHDGEGPRLADRVGSVEVRTVAGYDLHGNVYFYVRTRGKPPEPVSVSALSSGTGVTGRITESLARILAIIADESVSRHVANTRLPDWLGGDHQ